METMPDSHKTTQPRPTSLYGRSLILARLGWGVLVVSSLVLVITAVPVYYHKLLDYPLTAITVFQYSWPVTVYAAWLTTFQVIFILICFIAGLLIFWRKSDDWVSIFTSLTIITYGVSGTAIIYTIGVVEPFLRLPLFLVQVFGRIAIIVFLLLFPDGRFVPRWTSSLAFVWTGWILFWSLLPTTIFYNYPLDDWPLWTQLLLNAATLAAFVIGLGSQIYRFRQASTPVQRQQTKWILFGMGVMGLGYFGFIIPRITLPELNQPGLLQVQYNLIWSPFLIICMSFLPVSITVSILRYRLWEIDPLVNRTLVYGTLSASVIGIYILTVGLLSSLFYTQGNFFISLLATGLVAVLFQPLRERLQRGVNRLMYGERDDPAVVLTRLKQEMETAVDPPTVLLTIVKTVARSLKLPYAVIILPEGTDEWVLAAAYGLDAHDIPRLLHYDEPARLPLTYQSEKVGQLVLAPRAAGEPFTPPDMRLLTYVAHHAGTAVHTLKLYLALQNARERLVTAREEERRRLRRDLHDGLGPRLAGLAIRLDLAHNLIDQDTGQAKAVLQGLQEHLQEAIDNIRTIVYGLRPLPLDELGLVNAILEHARRQFGFQIRQAAVAANQKARDNNQVNLIIDIPNSLPDLPAAVEVAAYRVAIEALTNVARHSHARQCCLHLRIIETNVTEPGSKFKFNELPGLTNHSRNNPFTSLAISYLQLEIVDDGCGLPEQWQAGVGIHTMRERAAELGGCCLIEPAVNGGTRVLVNLPLTL